MKHAVSNTGNIKNDFHKWYFVFLDGRTIKRTACMYCGMINSYIDMIQPMVKYKWKTVILGVKVHPHMVNMM